MKIAGPNWNLDDVIAYIQRTGRADVEEDHFGNIVVYPSLYEDIDGNLCEGNQDESDFVLAVERKKKEVNPT